MSKKTSAAVSGIKHTRHQQKQKNTPTEQAAQIAEELQPRPCVPNVRAVDRGTPRLSWQRGDNDATHTTEAHPLFVREKIIPLENITKLTTMPDPKDDLFHSMNGLNPDARYEFYEHDVNWRNRIIHADSTAAMASLLEFDGLHGQVQTIYFAPPYGINFNANFQASTRQRDSTKEVLPHDPAAVRAFRDTYANGIHTYLDTIKRIVTYGRVLLADTGSLFLQIGNDNMAEIMVVLNEVFGKENRVAIIPFRKSGSSSTTLLPEVCDYILWYAKDKTRIKYNQLFEPITNRAEMLELLSSYAFLELPDGTIRRVTAAERQTPDLIPDTAELFRSTSITSQGEATTERSDPYTWNGNQYPCQKGRHWSVSHEGLDKLAALGRLFVYGKGGLRMKQYAHETPGRTVNNMWHVTMPPNDLHYVVETAESVIERCILMSSAPGDLVLDPTCGSGTTAYVAEKHGRRWITTDTSRTAINLARQRVATAIYDSYYLQDSPEGAKEEQAHGGTPRSAPFEHNVAHGFVHKRVQEVSPSSLAYDQPKEPTLLVNQPIPKPGTKRVAGPFTIELFSPHRYLPLSDRYDKTNDSDLPTPANNATEAVLHALRTTGITDPQAPRHPIRIDDIEEYVPGNPDGPSPYVTHTGLLRISRPKEPVAHEPCAILIAPPDVTVPATWIRNAISDTQLDRRNRHLVVLAFSYEAADLGAFARAKVHVHRAQINQDITIGLTDATGGAVGDLKNRKGDSSINLVGEPHIEVREATLAKHFEVEVHGTIAFDPKSKNVVTAGRETVEYWAVDTDYDNSAFHARDVHFPHPTDRQLERLQTQLGSTLDPARWDNFVGYTSRPFPKPKNGQIMVRIVTTTGTEMEAVHDIK